MKGGAGRRLLVPKGVADTVRTAHPEIRRKLRKAVEAVLSSPNAGKALKEELAGLRSYRVGRLRLIYRVAVDGTIEVVTIGPRSVIYEETARLLRKAHPLPSGGSIL